MFVVLERYMYIKFATRMPTAAYTVPIVFCISRSVSHNLLGRSNLESCAQVALPFLCQYMFPLSDCSTGTSYSATRDDCIMISKGVCADVWDLGLTFGYKLPNCDELPKANGKWIN